MYSERESSTRSVPSMPKIDTQLSSYWVKFFKNAGFPIDVATKHAVVFSNNRIRPDMLPDLDKPSLKEMGITLMGDMIAILRYAKKVVEETTCKNFLDAEESIISANSKPSSMSIVKPVVKKVATKTPIKSAVRTASSIVKTKGQSVGSKVVSNNSSGLKSSAIAKSALKKPVVKSSLDDMKIPSRMYSDYMDNTNNDHYPSAKRKYSDYNDGGSQQRQEDDYDDDNVLIWSDVPAPKRVRTTDGGRHGSSGSSMVKKPMPATLGQKFSTRMDEQKVNVFNRLGDSMVSSTTNSYSFDSYGEESRNNSGTQFNITGLSSGNYSNNFSSGNSNSYSSGSSNNYSSGSSNNYSSRNSYNDYSSGNSMNNFASLAGRDTRDSQGVFKRLGGKDYGNSKIVVRNGSSSNGNSGPTQGILKTRKPMLGTKVFAINTPSYNSLPIGTMRADEEASLRQIERSRPIARGSDEGFTNFAVMKANTGRDFMTGKLASDSMTLPAKSRLGGVKQVTFDNVTQVAHFSKPDVFSRLGL